MPTESGTSPRRKEGYAQFTRRPLNSLLMILPLLIFFHVVADHYRTDALLLAPDNLQHMLRYFGAPGSLLRILPAATVVIILLAQHLVHRDPWEFQPSVLAGMVGESVVWTVPLLAVSQLTARMVAAAPHVVHNQFVQTALVSVGAGIYEEFLFRMVLISLFLLLFVDVLGLKKDTMTVVAVLLAAGMFSLWHFAGFGGNETFTWNKFLFRSVAGTLWGGLFLFRGFGVAVGSHITWDLYALLSTAG